MSGYLAMVYFDFLLFSNLLCGPLFHILLKMFSRPKSGPAHTLNCASADSQHRPPLLRGNSSTSFLNRASYLSPASLLPNPKRQSDQMQRFEESQRLQAARSKVLPVMNHIPGHRVDRLYYMSGSGIQLKPKGKLCRSEEYDKLADMFTVRKKENTFFDLRENTSYQPYRVPKWERSVSAEGRTYSFISKNVSRSFEENSNSKDYMEELNSPDGRKVLDETLVELCTGKPKKQVDTSVTTSSLVPLSLSAFSESHLVNSPKTSHFRDSERVGFPQVESKHQMHSRPKADVLGDSEIANDDKLSSSLAPELPNNDRGDLNLIPVREHGASEFPEDITAINPIMPTSPISLAPLPNQPIKISVKVTPALKKKEQLEPLAVVIDEEDADTKISESSISRPPSCVEPVMIPRRVSNAHQLQLPDAEETDDVHREDLDNDNDSEIHAPSRTSVRRASRVSVELLAEVSELEKIAEEIMDTMKPVEETEDENNYYKPYNEEDYELMNVAEATEQEDVNVATIELANESPDPNGDGSGDECESEEHLSFRGRADSLDWNGVLAGAIAAVRKKGGRDNFRRQTKHLEPYEGNQWENLEVYELVTPQQQEVFTKKFRVADEDNSGQLDIDEIHKKILPGAKQDQVRYLARVFDVNGDGTINLKEFVAIVGLNDKLTGRLTTHSNIPLEMNLERCAYYMTVFREFFEMSDLDETGFISVPALLKIFEAVMGHQLHPDMNELILRVINKDDNANIDFVDVITLIPFFLRLYRFKVNRMLTVLDVELMRDRTKRYLLDYYDKEEMEDLS